MSSQIVPIPSDVATPARSGVFFFDLPAELRNNVYERFFPRGKYISFHIGPNAQQLPFRITDDGHPAINFPAQPPTSAEACAKLQSGLAMLLTCRQSYHECASALYSGNTFRFEQDAQGYSSVCYQLRAAVKFCRSLGFPTQFLRRLEIDVAFTGAHTCGCVLHRPGTTRRRQKCIDFAPLQRLMWAGAMKECDFRFVQSRPQVVPAPSHAQRQYDYNVNILNNVVSCLRNDTAGLRRYARQIGSMKICPSTTLTTNHCLMDLVRSAQPYRGLVQLRYRRGTGCLDVPLLLWEDHVNMLRSKAPHRPNFSDLPAPLRSSIFRKVLCPDAGIIVDLDTARRSAIERGLLDMGWPEHAIDNPRLVFWRDNMMIFRTTSTCHDISSSRFQRMEDVLCKERVFDGWRYPWFPQANLIAYSVVRLQLKFELKRSLTLADVDIGMKNLLRLASGYQNQRFGIECILLHEHAPEVVVEAARFSLLDLQAKVVELLVHVDGADVEEDDFEFYIDGHGRVKRLELAISSNKRVLHRDSLPQTKSLAEIIAKDGLHSDPSLDSEDESEGNYEGTLWSWISFVREVVTIRNDNNIFEEQRKQFLCHAKHFGIEETEDHDHRKVDLFPQPWNT